MTIETLKSPNPRNRNSISVIKSKFLSVSSMNTLLAILKVTDARRDVRLAGGLYQRLPWEHLPPREFDQPHSCLTPFLKVIISTARKYCPKVSPNGEKTIAIESHYKQIHISNIKCHLSKYGAFLSLFWDKI